MKKLSEFTVQDIEEMDYNNIISLVKETNRAPGGYKTIASILNNAFVTENFNILEIGTSTGITAIEITKAKKCSLTSIDINERSLAEAAERATTEGVKNHINFKLGDAQNLEFSDESFDMVFCGNVTSLIPDRKKACNEYVRVLKHNGILAAVPMYYIKKPSEELLSNVQKAIKTDVQVVDARHWLDFYNESGLLLKYVEHYKFDYIEDKTLDDFISYIMNQDFLKELSQDVYDTLNRKYKEYIYLFRDNLSHMGYSILLYQKNKYTKEPELFRGTLAI